MQWKSQWKDTMKVNSSAPKCYLPRETAWGTRLCSSLSLDKPAVDKRRVDESGLDKCRMVPNKWNSEIWKGSPPGCHTHGPLSLVWLRNYSQFGSKNTVCLAREGV